MVAKTMQNTGFYERKKQRLWKLKMGGRPRTFRNEFRLKNFGFNFLYLGESKHVFIQSQVSSWSVYCGDEYKNELLELWWVQKWTSSQMFHRMFKTRNRYFSVEEIDYLVQNVTWRRRKTKILNLPLKCYRKTPMFAFCFQRKADYSDGGVTLKLSFRKKNA